MLYDTIIVGAGLAGASAALHISGHERVLIAEAHQPAAGASGASAGLVNPMMGLKARPAWRYAEALEALDELVHLAESEHLFQSSGIVRPATTVKQAAFFRETARTFSDEVMWLSESEMTERYPGLKCDGGGLWVRRGGSVQVASFVRAMLKKAQSRGATLRMEVTVENWGTNGDLIWAAFRDEQNTRHRVKARRILFCVGYGYRRIDELASLNLHAIKGQTIRVACPRELDWLRAVPLSGQGYVAPDGEALVIGSTYERDFEDLLPSEQRSQEILDKAGLMVPTLNRASVLSARAGVRITVPGTRLPMVGHLPGLSNAWIFSGLGSKGILMAPLLSRRLPAWFKNPRDIPRELQVCKKEE